MAQVGCAKLNVAEISAWSDHGLSNQMPCIQVCQVMPGMPQCDSLQCGQSLLHEDLVLEHPLKVLWRLCPTF